MPSTQELVEIEAQMRLAELGGMRTRQDDIEFGPSWQIPERFREDVDEAIQELVNYRDAQYTETVFSRKFNYRPYDGNHAVEQVLKRDFGASYQIKDGLGRKPERTTINVGIKGDTPLTTSVPIGNLAFPWGLGTIELGYQNDPEKGPLFYVHCHMQKRFESHAEGFFKLVQKELDENSIYRHRAFDGNIMNPNFYDTGSINPASFVYTERAWDQINTAILSAMRDVDALKARNLPTKRVVLLEGEFGTGKTGALRTAMKVAVEECDRTVIVCRPGVDDPFEALKSASLYASQNCPVLVLIEDIDTYTQGTADPHYVTRFLDAFDGIGSKDRNIMLVMTTNHVEKIHKGMMRPGRLDAVIHIGAMDRPGVEKLAKLVLGDSLAPDVDWDAVFEATEGFMPAFVREAIDGAVRYAIAKHGDVENITTTDLIRSIEGLYNQKRLQDEAIDAIKSLPDLEAVFASLIANHSEIDTQAVLDAASSGADQAIEYRIDRAAVNWVDPESGSEVTARIVTN